MRIPEHKIDEIRNSADIVDIISTYVQLKKKGKNFQGLCPFHQEKTPSFVVSPEKQIYHCFGCHAGGNVYKFLMEFKNISFVEAIEEVAKQIGIPIEFEKGFDKKEQTEHELFYEINTLTAKFFVENLYRTEEALTYLENRKLKKKTLKSFGIGFAPFGWKNMVNFLEKNNIEKEKALLLGLIDKKEDKSYYDKFRGRIIFPIFSPNGRVVAFGGRILENNDNIAKYLNSPESLIYQKRKSLYGLFHSKDEIRKNDKAILVEGYMDLISLYQNGVKNVIASSGTSLTQEQVKLLSRFTKNIILLFDADLAGENATMRSINILLENDFEVKILSLPKGEDPDSFINKKGKDLFNEEVEKALNFLEYQISFFNKQDLFKTPEQQTDAIRKMIRTSALIKDDLKRNLLFKSIAKKFNLRENLIQQEAQNFFAKEKQNKDTVRSREKNIVPEKQNNKSFNNFPLEKTLIRLLFENSEEIIGHIFDNILPDDFRNTEFKEIAKIVYDSYLKHSFKASALIENFEDNQLKETVLSLTIENQTISKKWEENEDEEAKKIIAKKITDDTIKKYKVLQIENLIKRNNAAILNTENELERIELMKENKELNEEKIKIINEPTFFKNTK